MPSKSTALGAKRTPALWTPRPARTATAWLVGTIAVRVPDRVPTALGLNTTETLHAPPGGRLLTVAQPLSTSAKPSVGNTLGRGASRSPALRTVNSMGALSPPTG